MFCTLDDSTVNIMSELLSMPEPPKVKVDCLQQQVGGGNFGVFAIAFATSLAFKRIVQKFKQKMAVSQITALNRLFFVKL